METAAVSELRANLPGFLKKVETGNIISITSRGREIAWLVPPATARESARNTLRQLGQTALIGDVLSPVEDNWTAAK